MAQELTVQDGKFVRPAHLTQAFGDTPSNMKVMSMRVPTLSIQGKAFYITADGKEMRVEANINGERVALPSMPIIILGFNAERSRAYYEGAFDPKNIRPPNCWSKDGKKPDDAVKEKQHPTCTGCEKSIKGSRQSDNNKAVAACQEHRLLCVIPYKALHSQMPPLRLRLPPTSDYDGLNKEAKGENKFAFSQYVDHMRSHGVSHSFEMVTKVMFDQTEGITYPKLWFQPVDWVSEADTKRIVELREGTTFHDCLNLSEAEVVEQREDAKPQTRSDRGGTAKAGDPTAAAKAAQEAKDREEAAAEQRRQDAAREAAKQHAAKQAAEREAAEKAAAETRAREEREAAEKAAANGGGGVAMNLGDLGDLGDAPPQTTAPQAGMVVDAKDPPLANHVDDADVDDIMKQWSGD